jgi:3-deoxy-D-manno-octulosonic-acid transferase
MNIKTKSFLYQGEYLARILFFFPYTFFRRVVFGKDPVWKAFFFQSWGRLPKKLLDIVRDRESLWINTEAGGELTQAIPLCKALKEEFPAYNLLISTHKYESYQLALTIPSVDFAFFSPWDISFVVRKVLKRIRPKLLLSIDIVTAPVLIQEAHRSGFTTLLCSGFMNKHLENAKIVRRSMALDFTKYLSFIAVKDEVDKARFIQLGYPPKSIHVLGDLKYDILKVSEIAKTKRHWLRSLALNDNDKILTGASLHPGEEQFIIDSFVILRKRNPGFKLVIAPRFKEFIKQVETYLSALNFSFIKKTELNKDSKTHPDVIILDTFGELPYIYSATSYVLIGASSIPQGPGGGHNPIEPMLHGIPVFHGPHMAKYQEIVDELKRIWSGLEINTSKELARNILHLESNDVLKKKIKNRTRTIVEANTGSAKRHVDFIKNIIS